MEMLTKVCSGAGLIMAGSYFIGIVLGSILETPFHSAWIFLGMFLVMSGAFVFPTIKEIQDDKGGKK